MKLEEKGKIMPPPVLSKYLEMVSTEIQRWDNIIAATHWSLFDTTKIDGADFYVGEEELGHIHLDGEVHLPADKELKKALLDNKLAKPFRYGENWVEYTICDEEDALKAIQLFQINYRRIKGLPVKDLLREI
jgi:Family of unknown function (DUF5519)